MSLKIGDNIVCHECRMPLGVVNLCDNPWEGYKEVLCFSCIGKDPGLLSDQKTPDQEGCELPKYRKRHTWKTESDPD